MSRTFLTRLGVGLLAIAGAGCFAVATTEGSPPLDPDVGAAVASVLPSTIPVVDPAIDTVAPSTVPVVSSSPDRGVVIDRPATTSPTTSSVPTTLPLSPLAAELPETVSALPTSRPVVEPTSLSIPDVQLQVSIRDIGLEPDGQLEVPDETEVGWYRLGSSPGRSGATVLAAHVSWNDTTGPFFRLGELAPGARISVELADGGHREYEVVERAQYPKLGLPADRVWTLEGDESLVLITCGGEFNRSIRRYDDNIVVYAVPVAATPVDSG